MRPIVVAAALALLAGCAVGPSFTPGEPRETLIARWGLPFRIVPLPSGERLQYPQGPMGRQAWMVDVDGSGRVTGARQALTQENFNRIVPGQWTRQDVEREFGPPAWIDSVASWRGPILNYRWRDVANADMLYFVYLDEGNVVRRAHAGMEFRRFPVEKS